MLFKTSQADRNRLFDHIYEKIDKIERGMRTEYEGIEKKIKRQDKISAGINLQASNLKEQTLLT